MGGRKALALPELKNPALLALLTWQLLWLPMAVPLAIVDLLIQEQVIWRMREDRWGSRTSWNEANRFLAG